MNIVILKGNVTRDPELRYTPSGVAVVEIGVAVNKTWYDDGGNKHEKVTFVDCIAWRNAAENLAKHFSKGKPILIEGELSQDEWEDKETGQKRRKTRIVVNRWHFAGDLRGRPAAEEPPDRRGSTAPTSTRYPSPAAAGAGGPPPPPDGDGMEEDDIPF